MVFMAHRQVPFGTWLSCRLELNLRICGVEKLVAKTKRD